MTVRSFDPKRGDHVVIRDGILNEATGVVRMVYPNMAISVVLDEDVLDARELAKLTRSPETGKLHWVVEAGAYEVYDRRIFT